MHVWLAVALLVGSIHPEAAGGANDGAPVRSYLARAFAALSVNLLGAAEMMPEADYGFRPAGATGEVRTFAQLVGHTLEVNSFVCALVEGEKDPLTGVDGDAISDKSRLVSMLKESIALCTAAISGLTPDSVFEPITTTASDGSRRTSVPANALIFLIAHCNEHYGNIVTYLRARGLVPPRTPAQAGWREPAPAAPPPP